MTTTTPPQLSFALDNPGTSATVYISLDVSANKLTLEIASNVAASFAAGVVAPIEQAGQATGSLLYLDLSQLGMTEAEFNALTLDGSDWAFTNYSSASSQVIGFTPTEPVSLSGTGSLSLSLNNFTLASQPATPTVQLNVTYFRVDGVTQGSTPTMGNFAVSVTYPPDGHDQNLPTAILVSLSPGEVVNCPAGAPLPNSLTLTLSPGATPAMIYAVAGTRFTLTFIYAADPNGFGAMMTVGQAQPPLAVTAGQNASGWLVTSSTGNQSPSWTLTPPAGHPIVSTGVQSSVEFNIAGLVTNFQPGPTVVLVSYENVPGYKDGTYSILARKVAHVEVEDFVVSPERPVLDQNGFATVTLSWTAFYATRLTLNLTPASAPSASSVKAAQGNVVDVTGASSYVAQIRDGTQFELVAEGQSPDNLVNNRIVSRCTAYIEPVIAEFRADPPYVVDGAANACAISWKLNAPALTEITVSSSTGAQLFTSHESEGTVDAKFSEPQLLTLKAVPPCGHPVTSAEVDVFRTFMPVVESFNAYPLDDQVAHMQTFQESWSIEGPPGTAVTLFADSKNHTVSLAGSFTTYYVSQVLKLTAVAPGGFTATASKQIPVPGGST